MRPVYSDQRLLMNAALRSSLIYLFYTDTRKCITVRSLKLHIILLCHHMTPLDSERTRERRALVKMHNSLKLFKILFNRFNKDDKINHFHLHRSKINFCKIIFGIDFVILHTLLRGGELCFPVCIYQLRVIEHFIKSQTCTTSPCFAVFMRIHSFI